MNIQETVNWNRGPWKEGMGGTGKKVGRGLEGAGRETRTRKDESWKGNDEKNVSGKLRLNQKTIRHHVLLVLCL